LNIFLNRKTSSFFADGHQMLLAVNIMRCLFILFDMAGQIFCLFMRAVTPLESAIGSHPGSLFP
jgi:NADH:ubiquinone oxidoreductase subunit K